MDNLESGEIVKRYLDFEFSIKGGNSCAVVIAYCATGAGSFKKRDISEKS